MYLLLIFQYYERIKEKKCELMRSFIGTIASGNALQFFGGMICILLVRKFADEAFSKNISIYFGIETHLFPIL